MYPGDMVALYWHHYVLVPQLLLKFFNLHLHRIAERVPQGKEHFLF